MNWCVLLFQLNALRVGTNIRKRANLFLINDKQLITESHRIVLFESFRQSSIETDYTIFVRFQKKTDSIIKWDNMESPYATLLFDNYDLFL